MKLTHEQQAIIRSRSDIKINAVAGSGKTTTLIEYARSRPRNSRILYLAFNRTVRAEATKKFSDLNLHNVQIETAHSLAYKSVVFHHGYKVRNQGYSTFDIARILGLRSRGEKHIEYIVANHINKFISYFCNSDQQRVKDLNYLDIVSDPQARTFVKRFYKTIEKQTRRFLAKMDRNEIEITHDFYLKKFQLSAPVLPYDYILFDEAQDASGAMLDIILRQKAVKVIVGDSHQQIYGWRFAVNSLDKVPFEAHHLTHSFRFGSGTARLATEILEWKKLINLPAEVTIRGKGRFKQKKSEAVIGRTNLGLLMKAIEFLTGNQKFNKIHFEGNINSYTYAGDGASLYDVLNLYNLRKEYIRSDIIKAMSSFSELEEYVEKTEDKDLDLLIKIIREYGSQIPDLIQTLKERHTEDKNEADLIFSTVHRCKGMEYDIVHLVDDFIDDKKILQQKKEIMKGEISAAAINEEINLLYVAITRSRNLLYIPENLLPAHFSASENIITVISEMEEPKRFSSFSRKSSARSRKKQRKPRRTTPSAYQPWTNELDDELRQMFNAGTEIEVLATYFGRTPGAIRFRLQKLGLFEYFP